MKSYSVHARSTNVPVVSWYHKLKVIVTPVNYDIRPRIEKIKEMRGGDSLIVHRSGLHPHITPEVTWRSNWRLLSTFFPDYSFLARIDRTIKTRRSRFASFPLAGNNNLPSAIFFVQPKFFAVLN